MNIPVPAPTSIPSPAALDRVLSAPITISDRGPGFYEMNISPAVRAALAIGLGL
jgi:hypothetical protein